MKTGRVTIVCWRLHVYNEVMKLFICIVVLHSKHRGIKEVSELMFELLVVQVETTLWHSLTKSIWYCEETQFQFSWLDARYMTSLLLK